MRNMEPIRVRVRHYDTQVECSQSGCEQPAVHQINLVDQTGTVTTIAQFFCDTHYQNYMLHNGNVEVVE